MTTTDPIQALQALIAENAGRPGSPFGGGMAAPVSPFTLNLPYLGTGGYGPDPTRPMANGGAANTPPSHQVDSARPMGAAVPGAGGPADLPTLQRKVKMLEQPGAGGPRPAPGATTMRQPAAGGMGMGSAALGGLARSLGRGGSGAY